MITGIDHIEICVGNVEEVAEFFKKMGFQEIRRTDHHGGAIELMIPGSQNITFEFHYGKEIEPPGLNHIAFKVDDMEKTYKELSDKGISFTAPPKQSSNRNCKMCNTRCPAHMRYQFTD